jgi:hypothetical protein
MMPTITMADALIKAAANLVDTILGNLPPNTTTAQAAEQLMGIFKVQAKKTKCKARTARILREQVQAQRVLAEAQRMMTEEKITPNEIPDLETEEMPVSNVNRNQQTPMISQDNDNDDDYIRPPAANTQQQQQTRTDAGVHDAHDGATRRQSHAIHSTTSCLTKIPTAIFIRSCHRSTPQQNRRSTRISAPHQTSKIQTNVEQIIRNGYTTSSNYNRDNIFCRQK